MQGVAAENEVDRPNVLQWDPFNAEFTGVSRLSPIAWEQYPAGTPALRLCPSDINHALESHSRRWIRRHAVVTASGHRGAIVLGLLSILSAFAMLYTQPIAFSLGTSTWWVSGISLVISGGLLIAAFLVFRHAYRWAKPSLLLQLDRCGCCGNPLKSSPDEAGNQHCSLHQARCTECGVEWSSGLQMTHVASQLQRHCNAA